jgi:hypothetical protein
MATVASHSALEQDALQFRKIAIETGVCAPRIPKNILAVSAGMAIDTYQTAFLAGFRRSGRPGPEIEPDNRPADAA